MARLLVLSRLSGEHARELNELRPRLERALKHIRLQTHAARVEAE